MRLTPDVSRHKLAARWLVAAILGAGIVLQRGPQAIALASIAYFAVEGHRIQSVAGRRGTSVSELVESSGWLLRRGLLWVAIGLATVYNLLISGELTLTVISGVFLYAAGLFAEAARAAEDERPPEDGDGHRPDGERRPKDESRSGDDRQPSRT